MGIKYTQEEVNKIFNAHNLIPTENYINCKTKIKCINEDGYFININLDNVLLNKKGRPFSPNNIYTIENIKIFIDNDTNGEYEYSGGEYINAHSMIEVLHKKCGRIYKTKWCNLFRHPSENDINRHGTRCPFCEATQLESTHALILKQVWLHEKEGTIVEDKSCINPSTNCPLPTDIVNHKEKIAIEIQSWFHDFDDQKVKDEIKKNYWVNRGYQFYAPDQREYTVIQMIQLFFPNINHIPDYIDFDYSNKVNDVEIQRLLDKGMIVSQIAKQLDCSKHQVYDAIYSGRAAYPEKYKNACFVSVLKFDIDMNYIERYDTISNAEKDNNIPKGNIVLCINAGRYYCGGYIWVREKDYLSGKINLDIINKRIEKYSDPICQFDMKNNFIRKYESITIAAKNNNVNPYQIYKVVTGEKKSINKYKYAYTEK